MNILPRAIELVSWDAVLDPEPEIPATYEASIDRGVTWLPISVEAGVATAFIAGPLAPSPPENALILGLDRQHRLYSRATVGDERLVEYVDTITCTWR